MKKIFLIIWQFIKDVKNELQKVTWLTKKQTVDYTMVVIFISLSTAVFIGGLDFFFTYLMNRLLI